MNIKLYSTSSEVNVLNKLINYIDECSAVIKGNLSYENPVIVLQYKSSIQPEINYVYIPEYKRYYFIEDIIDLTGGRYEIHCNVDVLSSFNNDILKLSCVIDKQEYTDKSNLYYNDGSFIVLPQENITVINFANGFNENGEFILITAGG